VSRHANDLASTAGAASRGGRLPVWLDRRVMVWASYDVGSSAYYGVVTPLLFPLFYLTVVSAGESRFLAWGAALSIALVATAFLAPMMGNAVDRRGGRWKLLLLTTLLCCAATACLYLGGPGLPLLTIATFAVAQCAYLLAQPLYESYLPSIATPRTSGRVSTFGWGAGFLGGIATIALVWPLVAGGTGPDNLARFQVAFLVVATFFLLVGSAAVFGMRRILDPQVPRPQPGLSSVWRTLRDWREHRELFKLLLAFYLINEGMVTIGVFAAEFFRTNFGASAERLLLILLVYHLVAVPATLAFGALADHWTHRRAIFLSLSLWTVALILMAFGEGDWVPLAVVALFGTVFGSTTALFRSLLAQMAPREKATEFFGFNAFAGRLSAAVGPLLYGALATATGSQHIALLSVVVLLAIGAVVLAWVKLPDLRRMSLRRATEDAT